MEWTIQDFGAVGEFVSSFAVLATLLYLVFQNRQTQRIVRGQSHQAWADSTQYALLTVAESDYLIEIEVKLEAAGFPDNKTSVELLTPSEHGRYQRYLIANTHRLHSHLYHYSQGLVDEVLAPAAGQIWVRRLRAFDLDRPADALEQLYQSIDGPI